MDERLISLNAAIKTAHLPVIDDAGYEVVRVNDILALPSAHPGWIPVTERLPENEQEVFVTVEVRPIGCKPRRRVIKAFYTDGKHTDADSAYTWYELEELDCDDNGNIIIPEGWWEAVDYSDEFNMIDDFVVAWRELPEPWEGRQDD